jgi:hypothetical protein
MVRLMVQDATDPDSPAYTLHTMMKVYIRTHTRDGITDMLAQFTSSKYRSNFSRAKDLG